ncbi:MAG: hypothetical protein R3B38_01590 [Patescibacteria group bacterium]
MTYSVNGGEELIDAGVTNTYLFALPQELVSGFDDRRIRRLAR